MEWTPGSGRGTVHTFTVFHRRYHPAFDPPYAVAVVQLDEGPFFHTSIVDCDAEGLAIGMPVEVTFDGDGRPMPVFRPSALTRPAQ